MLVSDTNIPMDLTFSSLDSIANIDFKHNATVKNLKIIYPINGKNSILKESIE
jgi:hypothetical protein